MAPSEEFTDTICSASSLVITCEFCDRTYFAPQSEGDYNEGEYADLVKKSKEEPDKYIEAYEFTRWGTVDGKQAVIDCECGLPEVERIEKWIYRHRFIIGEYLAIRAKIGLRRARLNEENANLTKRAIEKLGTRELDI